MHIRVDHLHGLIADAKGRPSKYNDSDGEPGSADYPALYIEGQLCAFGEALGMPARAPIAQATAEGCSWGSVLSFPLKVLLLQAQSKHSIPWHFIADLPCGDIQHQGAYMLASLGKMRRGGGLQYCDLAHDAQLALTVWHVREGAQPAPLGGATLRLFSKKGRLKSGRQDLNLWLDRQADVAWPPRHARQAARVPAGRAGVRLGLASDPPCRSVRATVTSAACSCERCCARILPGTADCRSAGEGRCAAAGSLRHTAPGLQAPGAARKAVQPEGGGARGVAGPPDLHAHPPAAGAGAHRGRTMSQSPLLPAGTPCPQPA